MGTKSRCLKFLPYLCGLTMISLSSYLILEKPYEKLVRTAVGKEVELREGTVGYDKKWQELELVFRVYIFDVLNPDEIMEGATPKFREMGPYVYNMNTKKEVIRINEETDEMEFMSTRTYYFNKQLSGGSEDDEVTIVNSAYMGTIGTIVSAFPAFLTKLGNDIQKLFPDMDDIFVRAKVGNILFRGLPMECDVNKYKELKMICGFLMGKKPDGIRDTDVPGVYAWSFFERLNGTSQGPMTVNRGVKNKSLLGDTTAFKGKRVQKFWKSEECNTVAGTDSVTWAPMTKRSKSVLTYEPQICRSVNVEFKDEVVMNGLIGWRYEMSESAWQAESTECYCPLVKRQPVCPPTGIIDLTTCQQAPIFYSEPHFLHGDPSLLVYANGLHPNKTVHSTYITIEPLSGVPLSGSKKLQLSAKIIKSPVVEILSNVTEGYFPILWVAEEKTTDIDLLGTIVQAHRLNRLFAYLIYVPLVAGIFLIVMAIYLNAYTNGDRRNFSSTKSLESVVARTTDRKPWASERKVTRTSRIGF